MSASGPAPNILHGNTVYTPMPPKAWAEVWKDDKTVFHLDSKNDSLVRHIDKLINGRKAITFFFPFCGKAVDMKWLYDEGHNIVGTDCAAQALEEFFKDNCLDYAIETVPSMGSVYKSSDGRIRLYCGNQFDLKPSMCGLVDGIWDRGGLVAVDREHRQQYVDSVLGVMSPDCRYLVDVIYYDASEYIGPPYTLSDDDVHSLYGEKCDIKALETEDWTATYKKKYGVSKMDKTVYMLTLKG